MTEKARGARLAVTLPKGTLDETWKSLYFSTLGGLTLINHLAIGWPRTTESSTRRRRRRGLDSNNSGRLSTDKRHRPPGGAGHSTRARARDPASVASARQVAPSARAADVAGTCANTSRACTLPLAARTAHQPSDQTAPLEQITNNDRDCEITEPDQGSARFSGRGVHLVPWAFLKWWGKVMRTVSKRR